MVESIVGGGVVGPIRNLRWWIGGLLFASTVINYLDRQTLSVLGPLLKEEYQWTNADFATILLSFRLAYTLMQAVAGRMLDWLGTRVGLALAVAFYSTVGCLTAMAGGIRSFQVFRFLLGCGEAANWPGATKAVSEWFPARERGWAVALFDSGSSIGGALAPFIVLTVYQYFGNWRPAFVVTGGLGFLWLIAWLRMYQLPARHPRISTAELAHIRQDADAAVPQQSAVPWIRLLWYRQTWGIILGRMLLDPYWIMIADWFAIYLVSKGFPLQDSLLGFLIPFIAADLGNFCGGGLSSYWIKKGWPVGKARRTVLLIFGPSMVLLIPAAFSSNYWLIVSLIAYATFAYACCATIFLSLPADVFQGRAVASVSGLSGTGSGVGSLAATYLIGQVADHYSFQPIIIVASLVPCVATAIMVALVRTTKKPDSGGLLIPF